MPGLVGSIISQQDTGCQEYGMVLASRCLSYCTNIQDYKYLCSETRLLESALNICSEAEVTRDHDMLKEAILLLIDYFRADRELLSAFTPAILGTIKVLIESWEEHTMVAQHIMALLREAIERLDGSIVMEKILGDSFSDVIPHVIAKGSRGAELVGIEIVQIIARKCGPQGRSWLLKSGALAAVLKVLKLEPARGNHLLIAVHETLALVLQSDVDFFLPWYREQRNLVHDLKNIITKYPACQYVLKVLEGDDPTVTKLVFFDWLEISGLSRSLVRGKDS